MGLYDLDKEDTTTYEVVVKHEEQYSIVRQAVNDAATVSRYQAEMTDQQNA